MPAVRRLPELAEMTWVTAGAMTANVAGYLLQVLAGRWLGVAGFSEFASLLAVQLLCAVPALALQNVLARELIRGAPVAALRGVAWRCAAVVTVFAAGVIPLVTMVLSVSLNAGAAALSAAPLLVLLSGEQGVLQGRQRFRGLAVVLGVAGILRVVPALAVLVSGGGAASALWAGTCGIGVAALTARLVARRSSAGPLADADVHAESIGWSGVYAVVRAAQVQAALMALSSADLIVARMVLSETEASRYALGAIATKIAFWFPQAVGVVLYPRMAQPSGSVQAIRSAITVLLGVGTVAVVGAAVASPLASVFAGPDYAPIQGLLWLFALHGAILSVLQGVLLSAIAVDRTALAGVTWIGLGLEVAALLLFASSLVLVIGLATVAAAVTTLVVTLRVLRVMGPKTMGSGSP